MGAVHLPEGVAPAATEAAEDTGTGEQPAGMPAELAALFNRRRQLLRRQLLRRQMVPPRGYGRPR